jgi:Icc-related predicted phosphoesterase
MIGSYTDFDEHSQQHKWLEADLGSIDRKKTPWVIVLLHAPWYNTNNAHQGEGESMRKAMEELLYKARVDVVFAGHVHAYERFVSPLNSVYNICFIR